MAALFLFIRIMTITILGKEYRLKYTLRAMIIFEKITKKSFSISSFTDQLVYLYALILANNSECSLTMDELINACDDDPKILENYLSFLQGKNKKDAILNPSESDGGDKKKE